MSSSVLFGLLRVRGFAQCRLLLRAEQYAQGNERQGSFFCKHEVPFRRCQVEAALVVGGLPSWSNSLKVVDYIHKIGQKVRAGENGNSLKLHNGLVYKRLQK